jgi:hypothetical protein
MNANDDDWRIANGAMVTLQALLNLYMIKDPRWDEIKDQLKVGLYKETPKDGNTSVSMGLAVAFFERNPDRIVVAFANCGSGGCFPVCVCIFSVVIFICLSALFLVCHSRLFFVIMHFVLLY